VSLLIDKISGVMQKAARE